MRATDLLGRPVRDAEGRDLGPLRDLRVDRDPGPDGRLALRWLVVGGGETAHRLGFEEGRTTGPRLLVRLVRGRGPSALMVPVDSVQQWGPDAVVLRERADQVAVPASAANSWWEEDRDADDR